MPEPLNIYQMYNINGHKTGFKIIRNSWSTIYAIVREINGQIEGKLKGPYPYYRNPEVTVDIYNNDGSLQKKGVALSCPGTYAYTWIREEK